MYTLLTASALKACCSMNTQILTLKADIAADLKAIAALYTTPNA